jgi:formimidoylglutamate deiminase
MIERKIQAWLPDLIYTDGRFHRDLALVADERGCIVRLVPMQELPPINLIRLKNRALLPGLVNAHSHAFQRAIRGRTEYRTKNERDSFWTWREQMYEAANRLTPDDIYDVSRMAFLEMALSGITAVGEFHYLHHAPDGTRYEDPNLLAKEVVRAARDVGLRIALLCVAYARSGYQTGANPRQARFLESEPETYLARLERLRSDLREPEEAWVGVAPHSVRAVPLNYLKEVVHYALEQKLPVHMHLAEQSEEVIACTEEYGRSPVSLLYSEGLLSERFTGVHIIHSTPAEIRVFAQAGATVCACPTTERNLGDGIVPADLFLEHGVQLSFGTDSNVQIDLLEEARELEYHLRLERLERVILAPTGEASSSALAARLFECTTSGGAQSIGTPSGKLEPGMRADFFTVDLNDPSIAGSSEHDLIASIIFSLSRTAVCDVFVGGKQIVSESRHQGQEEIVQLFTKLQRKLWN